MKWIKKIGLRKKELSFGKRGENGNSDHLL
jgi:hypothetical protein